MDDKVLVINPALCTGCHSCEMSCSLIHDGKCDFNLSRIGIMKTGGGGTGENIQVVCRQCEEPICVDVCIMGALFRDEETGAILIHEDFCVGCKTCVTACPFGGMVFHHEKNCAVKCDLCGGDPECVKACAYEALLYLDISEWTVFQRRKGMSSLVKIYDSNAS